MSEEGVGKDEVLREGREAWMGECDNSRRRGVEGGRSEACEAEARCPSGVRVGTSQSPTSTTRGVGGI